MMMQSRILSAEYRWPTPLMVLHQHIEHGSVEISTSIGWEKIDGAAPPFCCVASGPGGNLELAKFALCAKMQPLESLDGCPEPPGAWLGLGMEWRRERVTSPKRPT
jgi:hypothetical protein